MRAALVIAAVATGCGGPPAAPPPRAPAPIEGTVPARRPDGPARGEGPPPATITKHETIFVEPPAQPRATWLVTLEADAERVCRCADLACAHAVFTEGTGLGLPKGALTPAQQARVNAALARLAACHAELQRAAPP